MRRIAIVILLLGCGDRLRVAPLPELVVARTPPSEIAVRQLWLVPGEHLIWEVHAGGIAIGRAELDVGATEARSRFATDSLAGALMSVRDELSTTLDRAAARATASTETLELGGETERFDATFAGASYTLGGKTLPIAGGNFGQTIHSALGVLRAWVEPDARPGYVMVLVAGRLYRLDVTRPTVEDLQGTRTLRIDGRIHAAESIGFVMWLAATPARTPLRIELSNDDVHVTAELVVS